MFGGGTPVVVVHVLSKPSTAGRRDVVNVSAPRAPSNHMGHSLGDVPVFFEDVEGGVEA